MHEQTEITQANAAGSKSDAAVFWTCLALTAIVFAAFALFQYSTPTSFEPVRGQDWRGIDLFARHLHLARTEAAADSFINGFRIFLIALFGINVCGAAAALKVNPKHQKAVVTLIVLLCIFTALVFPPAESRDTFNYAGLARIFSYYGLNPYVHSTYVLADRRDETTPYIQMLFTSVYGPLWTWLSAGIVTLLRGPGLFAQIVAFKLVEAAALTVAALAARAYCVRRDPSYGLPALIAVGLNPLCLLEGPGNGHNDMLMMALFLVGLCYYDREMYRRSGLMIGLSMSIKFVPAFMLPWVLLDGFIQRKRLSLTVIALSALLLALPTVLLAPAFWNGGAALGGFLQRSELHPETMQQAIAAGHPPAPEHSGGHPLHLIGSQIGLITLYLGLTAVLAARRRIARFSWAAKLIDFCVGREPYPAWLVVWVLFASVQERFISGYWFSWYYLWAILPAACLWTRRGNALWIWSMAWALSDTMHYTV